MGTIAFLDELWIPVHCLPIPQQFPSLPELHQFRQFLPLSRQTALLEGQSLEIRKTFAFQWMY